MVHVVLKSLLLLFILIASVFALFWMVNFLVQTIIAVPKPNFGVTFSTKYSRELGLDPLETYQAVLTDLSVKKFRLPVYWDEVEKTPGNFDFSFYDTLLNQAKNQRAEVILVLGYKVPRWPECFPPIWAQKSMQIQLKPQILFFLEQSIKHFKNNQAITSWQIENEPLLDFGLCKIMDKNFLKQEVALVKSLDSRPIILTDSGELGLWVTALQESNLMGTSLYKIVWNPIFGYFRYPLPPLFYSLKAYITQKVFAPSSQGVMVSEVQAEPWSPGKPIVQNNIEELALIFPLKSFEEVVEFTSQTRIKQQYLWGVEWWYYMKLHGHPEYWEYARSLFE